jgi:putative membrane protein insertion efficiency factor
MKKLLLKMIRFYQKHISAHTSPKCRFSPTCSAYAAEAIEVHGVIKGCGLAAWRILRCNPCGGSGYDPVPPKKEKNKL